MKIQNTKGAIELVMRLMAIPGKSCEEGMVADEIMQVLKDFGVAASCMSFDSAHKKSAFPGQVGNLIVKLPGARQRPRLMLSAHMDTVPVCIGSEPKRRAGIIKSANANTGLGADDRAGCAAVLVAAMEALATDEPHGPLTLCFFVQEEIGLHGSRHLTVSKLGRPGMALNFDGGNPYKLTIGASGGERFKIKLHGLSAHAGLAPQEGASAVNAAGLAIAALVKDKWLGRVRKNGQEGTSNIGVVRGGVATNVVADYVEIEAEARSHEAAFRTAMANAIEKAFVMAAARTKSTTGQAVQAEILRRVDYESFRLDPKSESVALVSDAIRAVGAKPMPTVTNGGVDANWIVKHGIPTVTIGCGQRDVHTNQESLVIDDYLAACLIGAQVIQNFGNTA